MERTTSLLKHPPLTHLTHTQTVIYIYIYIYIYMYLSCSLLLDPQIENFARTMLEVLHCALQVLLHVIGTRRAQP